MKSKPLYKLLLMLFLFVMAIAVLDVSIGAGLKYLAFNQDSGDYHKLIDCIEKKDSEIIIIGNSRAERQFIPSIIDNKTGLSTYNLGYGGRDLNFVNALTSVIVKRNPPKYLLIEFQMTNLRMPIKYDRMSFLNPFYYRYPELQPFLNRGEVSRGLAFYSSLFQFNSSTWDIISPYFQKENLELGYRPLYGKLAPNSLKNEALKIDEVEQEKVLMQKEVQEIFENILHQTNENNIKVIIVMSPLYKQEKNSKKYYSERDYINQFDNLLIWDYSQDFDFTNKSELYNDVRHLNHDGAILFTKKIAARINRELID